MLLCCKAGLSLSGLVQLPGTCAHTLAGELWLLFPAVLFGTQRTCRRLATNALQLSQYSLRAGIGLKPCSQ